MTHFASAVPKTHVPSAVARSALWISLFFEKSEFVFLEFRFSLLGFSVPSQICTDVSLDTVFSSSVGMKREILSHLSLLVGLSERLQFVPYHLVCCWVFCAFFKPVSVFTRLHFKYHPKTGQVCAALGPFSKNSFGRVT